MDGAEESTPDFETIQRMNDDEQHRLAETVVRLTMGEEVSPAMVVHDPGSDSFGASAEQVYTALVARDAGVDPDDVETPDDDLIARSLAKKRLTEEFPDADTPDGLLTSTGHNEALLRMGMEQGGYEDAMEFVDDVDRAATEFERIDQRAPEDDPFEEALGADPDGDEREGALSGLRERLSSVRESLQAGGERQY
jgi:hypothetical protein